MKHLSILTVILLYFSTTVAIAQPTRTEMPDARMLRFPDVSAEKIVFVYASDLWTVSKNGGLARKLSSPKEQELFPKFSPDGQTIAFSGNYDGNTDVYVMLAEGGTPRRLTHHSDDELVVEWYPDGKHILYRSRMVSPSHRFNRFFKQSIDGGWISAPAFSFWNTEGDWEVEGWGVDPDYEIENAPDEMVAGRDPQLEKAIEVILEMLEEEPPKRPKRPAYPDRSDRIK